MKLIVGLGNPGNQYKNTRHNVGFLCLDEIAKHYNLEWTKNKKFNALICEHSDSILVKPLTFMNRSGESVAKIMNYYNMLPKKLKIFAKKDSNLEDKLIVIHDDLDIKLGKYKISNNSRSAGHNGVQSIINHTKTKNFTRYRIGIMGDKPEQMPGIKYVLQKFSSNELDIMVPVLKDLVEAISN